MAVEPNNHFVVIDNRVVTISQLATGEWVLSVEGHELDRAASGSVASLRGDIAPGSEVEVEAHTREDGITQLSVMHNGTEFALYNLEAWHGASR